MKIKISTEERKRISNDTMYNGGKMTTDLLRGKPGTVAATIILRSGMYFDYINPSADTVCIDDIAWGLANTCRFGGQSLQYYSVAQHGVLVSENVPLELRLDALMHDAAEAYVGDIVSPLKQLLPDFKIVEERVEAVIFEKYKLKNTKHPDIKHADLRLLRTEQRDLTSGHADNWNGLNAYPPLPERIKPLLPADAAELFLEAWYSR